jgi:transcription antitermination factor NusG
MKEKWYAVCTKPKCEQKVGAMLTKLKIEHFCPMKKTRKGTLLKREEEEPLLPSVVFVRISEEQLQEVKTLDGVINFFYWLDQPAVVKSQEIATIKSFILDHSNILLQKIPINPKAVARISYEMVTAVEQEDTIQSRFKIARAFLPSLGYMLQAKVLMAVDEIVAPASVSYLYPQHRYGDAS